MRKKVFVLLVRRQECAGCDELENQQLLLFR